MKTVVGAVGVVLVMACGPDGRPFDTHRIYTHELFATPEQCDEARRHGVFNCHQEAVFCSSGRAIFMFTDILNPATYRVDDDLITVRFVPTPEADETMRFRLAADGMTMTDVGIARTWMRRLDLESVGGALHCEDG